MAIFLMEDNGKYVVHEDVNGELQSKFFDTREEALNWINYIKEVDDD